MLSLIAAPVFPLSSSGDSALSDLDTIAPSPGTATVPPSAVVTGVSIPYAGASDASGIARVELWAREDSSSWAFTTQYFVTTSGSFTFVPGGTGLYHFDLVAEDSVGNRTPVPSGGSGTGQGSTLFTSSIDDWSLIDQ